MARLATRDLRPVTRVCEFFTHLFFMPQNRHFVTKIL